MTTPARERKAQRIRAAVRTLGLHVELVGGNGALRIRGAGIDILVADIYSLDERELKPAVDHHDESSADDR